MCTISLAYAHVYVVKMISQIKDWYSIVAKSLKMFMVTKGCFILLANKHVQMNESKY